MGLFVDALQDKGLKRNAAAVFPKAFQVRLQHGCNEVLNNPWRVLTAWRQLWIGAHGRKISALRKWSARAGITLRSAAGLCGDFKTWLLTVRNPWRPQVELKVLEESPADGEELLALLWFLILFVAQELHGFAQTCSWRCLGLKEEKKP